MSTKFTCRFCKEQYDQPKGLYKHLQLVHNAGMSRDNKYCPICGILCATYESYRDHLLYIHGQTDEGQKLTFKSLNEFLVWKAELEKKHNCKYVLQTSPKVLPTKEKKYFYQCDRSDSKYKDRKSVVMKTCSSVISVIEGTGVFKVEYWDNHSGHDDVHTVPGVQTQSELDAAISSVEMVNAIGDSDDSFDHSEDLLMPENTDKQTFILKTNSPTNSLLKSPVINSFQKTKVTQSGKVDVAKKKASNTSILFSLASVACGKGISKKPANKVSESKNADNQIIGQSSTKPTESNDKTEKPAIDDSADPALKQKDISVSQDAVNTEKSVETITTKSTTSGPPAIAPKPPPVSSNTVNPLFTNNNAFPNQFVIVNPVSMGQNSLNSNSVFTAGQNILLSLGPVGQNVLPTSASQNAIQTSEVKKSASTNSTNVSVADTSLKVNKSSTAKKSFSSPSKSALKSTTSAIPSNSPITLTSGLNNTPLLLSSLPVGSTFMSVNNNLIPIASPSGAFIPTSLPPNIVLTPVVPGTTLPSVNSLLSSANSITSTPKNTQIRFSAPSTAAITVSSIVKEPVYTSSTIKHMSNILTPSASPVSTHTLKNSIQRNLNKFVPITTADRVSSGKNENKSTASPKGSFNASKAKNSPNFASDKAEIDSALVIDTPVLTSSIKPSARKRISRVPSKPESVVSVVTSSVALSTFTTKVVNSRLHLTPISSTPSVTVAPQLNTQKPGTMLFESSAGDIYMLEPIEESQAPTKTVPSMEIPKIKIERSVQTTESSFSTSGFNSSSRRKRALPPTDDSAVMLKVKCYQLEMKYLNTQTECKRLKVELTKERLKNAELSGKKAPAGLEEDATTNMSNAAEIMKEIEDRFSGSKDVNIYTMTKTSVLRSLYEDLEELCTENNQLYKELENYRAHDKFYKNLKKKLYDEEF